MSGHKPPKNLFGRAMDIRRLLDEAARPGLTVVVGRPRMGKTSTLAEVARQLMEDGRYLVGYHEANSAESNHLLFAVADLHARWLASGERRQELVDAWRRVAPTLIPRIGQVMGELLHALSVGVIPAGVTQLVRTVFGKLAEAQRNIETGGLQIPALPYEEAKQLVQLVADVSGRRVVLILDAWEKSLSARRSDFHTIEAIMRNDDAWSQVHVFTAVRYPDGQMREREAIAYRELETLWRIFPLARRYELAAMDHADAEPLLTFVRRHVYAARAVPDERLLALVDGYPGVLEHWVKGWSRNEMRTESDLEKVAGDAHANLYPDLEYRLEGLRPEARALAARVALLPRLDDTQWSVYRDIVWPSGGGDAFEDLVNALIDSNVFVDVDGATTRCVTYGHDTRHAVARRWFVDYAAPMMRREAQRMVLALAAGITGDEPRSFHFVTALVACARTCKRVHVGEPFESLFEAAQWVFDGNVGLPSEANFDDQTIQVYPGLIAWARNNRAVSLYEQGDKAAALADYNAVIAMPGAPVEHLAMSLWNRSQLRASEDDVDGACEDCTAVIGLPDAPVDLIARALRLRATMRSGQDDVDRALADFDAVIALPGAPVDEVAEAYSWRADIRRDRGDSHGALADADAVLALPGAPAKEVAYALWWRAVERGDRGDTGGALADLDSLILLSGAPVGLVARAYSSRAEMRLDKGDNLGALSDFDAVIVLPGAPAKQVAYALVWRAAWCHQHEDREGMLADLTSVIALPEAPVDSVVHALFWRGDARAKKGDLVGEIEDYRTLISMPGAPTPMVAGALVRCAERSVAQGDKQGALADFDNAIALPEVQVDEVSKALALRGILRGEMGDLAGELADYTTVIAMPGAAVESVARALLCRADTYIDLGAMDDALADCDAVLMLPDVPAEVLKTASQYRRLLLEWEDRCQGVHADRQY